MKTIIFICFFFGWIAGCLTIFSIGTINCKQQGYKGWTAEYGCYNKMETKTLYEK